VDIPGIREALHKQPFEPFTIELADGRSLPVRHPDFVAVGPRRIIVVADDDSWSVVEPLLIVSIDDTPMKPSRGNGGPPSQTIFRGLNASGTYPATPLGGCPGVHWQIERAFRGDGWGLSFAYGGGVEVRLPRGHH
jgi:hypothetical protein